MKIIIKNMICVLAIFIFEESVVAADMEQVNKYVELLDYNVNIEVTINRSAKDVWPFIKSFEMWHPGMKVSTVGGELHREGEVKKITYKGAEPFYTKVIKIVPNKHMVGKMGVTEEGLGKGSYAHFRLIELDEMTTKVVYDVYAEVEIPPTEINKLSPLRTEFEKKYLEGIKQYFDILKSMVENSQ